MAKTAASEDRLGDLHSTLTRVFDSALKGTEKQLAAVEAHNDKILAGEGNEGETVIDPGSMVNVALLATVSSFLKANNVGPSLEQIDGLSETQRRLEARAKKRPAKLSLADVPVMQ